MNLCKFRKNYLVEQPILRIPNFNFPNLKCCKVVFYFQYNEIYWHFWVYCDIDLKLLLGKNTQKVNKQKLVVKIRDLYWLFI